MQPHLDFEKKLWKKGFVVIGVDEVGRGAFAGPLVLSGVIFKPPFYTSITAQPERSFQTYITFLESLGINDSKKLSPQKRESLAPLIKKLCLQHITVSISVEVINKIGIGKATELGVRKIIKKLLVARSPISRQGGIRASNKQEAKYFLLMDGFHIKYVKGIGLKNQKGIVRGDSISLSIAAASIIAKVHRDQYMTRLAKKFPHYFWDENKGYGTLQHRTVLRKIGKTTHHRIVFLAKSLQDVSVQGKDA